MSFSLLIDWLFSSPRCLNDPANNDVIEPFDFSSSQIDQYLSQKRDFKLANVKSAYIRSGKAQIFNRKLFQTRPGFVEFTSEIVEQFTELNESNKKVHKLRLSWTPANLWVVFFFICFCFSHRHALKDLLIISHFVLSLLSFIRVPDSVILKADLEKHRTKFVSEFQLNRLENTNNELYDRKRRRRWTRRLLSIFIEFYRIYNISIFFSF